MLGNVMLGNHTTLKIISHRMTKEFTTAGCVDFPSLVGVGGGGAQKLVQL